MSLAVIAAVLGASLGATPVLADTVLSRPAALSDGQAAATTGDTGSEAAVAEQDAPAASEAVPSVPKVSSTRRALSSRG